MGTLYLLLFPIAAVCFLVALATDVAYAASAYLMWLHFSEWLIAAGLMFGAVAALVLLVEFFTRRTMRATAVGWAHLALFYAALAVGLCNALVHTIDGWTAVVPTGMALSAVAALLALGAVWTLLRLPSAWNGVRAVRP
jgi:uncharacterized membrane protein